MPLSTKVVSEIPLKPASAGTSPVLLHTYWVACVEKIPAPDGGEGVDWRRYVLESGRSVITGQRRGSRQDVFLYATECAERLNARGRKGESSWSPRNKKPTAL